MNKTLVITLTALTTLLEGRAQGAGRGLMAQGQGQAQGQAQIQAQATAASSANKPWMKCVGSTLSTQTNSAPSASASATFNGNVGLTFTLEPNNGSEISVDAFSLNAQGQKIKQIGHAEVLSSNGQGSSGASAVTLQNSPDSPFAFNMTVSSPTSPQNSSPSGLTPAAQAEAPTNVVQSTTGVLTAGVLFNAQTLSQLSVQCRIVLPPNQQGASANPL
jgi:hypothetical protein